MFTGFGLSREYMGRACGFSTGLKSRHIPYPAGINLWVYPRPVSIIILEAAMYIIYLISNTFESSCVYINIQHMSNKLVSLLCSSVLGAALEDCALFDQGHAFFFCIQGCSIYYQTTPLVHHLRV
jgi:hypothetical protein